MDRLKILVVDDESRMRKLVRDFLVKHDFDVVEAGDGEAALDLFYDDKDIALIILDVMMPKMNGWEVCREIRESSKVPIIMLTAKSDESDELMGFELGVDEYISKPFSPKILVARVEADSPQTVADYRARLEAKMQEVLERTAVDESRILQEAAIFADKVAVDEETVRLRSHLAQMETMLASGGAVGRKLDFLLQEMNREANTIGSKCTDLRLAQVVVEIKGELEKIREQIQNIE